MTAIGDRPARAARAAGHDAISITGLTKVFSRDGGSERHIAVADLELTVREGEFMCLLGPSGCGKTTVLHPVTGSERPTAGQISVFGRPVWAQRYATDRRTLGGPKLASLTC